MSEPIPSKLRPILSPKYRGEVNWKTGTVTFIRDDENGVFTEEDVKKYLIRAEATHEKENHDGGQHNTL